MPLQRVSIGSGRKAARGYLDLGINTALDLEGLRMIGQNGPKPVRCLDPDSRSSLSSAHPDVINTNALSDGHYRIQGPSI